MHTTSISSPVKKIQLWAILCHANSSIIVWATRSFRKEENFITVEAEISNNWELLQRKNLDILVADHSIQSLVKKPSPFLYIFSLQQILHLNLGVLNRVDNILDSKQFMWKKYYLPLSKSIWPRDWRKSIEEQQIPTHTPALCSRRLISATWQIDEYKMSLVEHFQKSIQMVQLTQWKYDYSCMNQVLSTRICMKHSRCSLLTIYQPFLRPILILAIFTIQNKEINK